MYTMKKIAGILLVSTIGALAGVGIYKLVENKPTPTLLGVNTVPVRLVNHAGGLPDGSVSFVQAAEMTVHSVVNIKTEFRQESFNSNFFFNDPFHNFLFGDRNSGMYPPQVQMASGSGVIISENGYIATNNHVVDRADKIEVTLNDKRTYTAEVIGKDPTTDLALLKINEKGLPFIVYGNSDEVKIGEWVLAVGNPFNLTSTVTAGIVSAKGRNINILENDPSKGIYPIESFIQTDAAVNPGNSGGALVNTNGHLIGINSAIASNTGSYSGYSFAIPVNIVKKVMNDLLEFGSVQRAFIGVSIRDLDSKLAEEKNIKEYKKGVYVAGLTEEGAAEKAGIKEGDIITRIGKAEVNTSAELQEQVSNFRPGDRISVSYVHDGKETVAELVLKNKNGGTEVNKEEKIETATLLGATFEPISLEEKKKLHISNGLKIKKLESGKLFNSGIKENFIIMNIDKKPVDSLSDLTAILENKRGGVLIEGIYPNGMRAYYGFGL
jgi:serine protease Do